MILTHSLETKVSLPNCHTAIIHLLAASVSSILRLTQALKHTTCTCTAHSQTLSAGPNQFFRNSISISLFYLGEMLKIVECFSGT